MSAPRIRIGQGYDVHAFAPAPTVEATTSVTSATGTEIVLGGVHIAAERPLLAYSDGDVLLHALCDALLGSLALGDIGNHFPDTSAEFKNIDSRELLRRVAALIAERGFTVANVDTTIAAQRPKLSGYIDRMRANIADDLGLTVDAVSVKATTTEQLGFVGREEGIACYATVLVESRA